MRKTWIKTKNIIGLANITQFVARSQMQRKGQQNYGLKKKKK